MRTVRVHLLLLLFTATVTAATAQERVVITGAAAPGEGIQLPGMPGARPVKTGTGRILGRVLSAESGTPIRRVQVRISGTDIGSKTAMTDGEGRYEFRDLPAGRFTLNTTKSGYVSVQYGQNRPFESGRPIELADKQVVDKADIIMPRGGVISGRIVDEFGEPVADAMVSAMRQTWMNGRRRFVPAGRPDQTNDLGQFRMYGLPPGDYYVSAILRNEAMLFDMMGAQGGPVGSTPPSGYSPTYFPGTSTPAEAQKVTLAIAQEAQQIDFALLPVRLAKISGVVMSSDGKPVENAMVNAVPANRSGDVGMMMVGTSARTTKDGVFSLNGVAPGDYTLNARSIRMVTSEGGAGMVFTATIGGGPGGDDSEFAAQPVTVAGEDLSNLVIVTSKGATASGRISFEGTAKPANVTGIRVSAMTTDFSDGPVLIGGSSAAAKADGTFEIKGLAGQRLIRVSNLPQGWMLKSVRLQGNDVTDTAVDFKSGEQYPNIEIVATSKTTEINGGVTMANGAPMKDYTVIVFSENPDHWSIPMTRWVTGARPDQDGRFKIRNMPAGGYYAVAVDYIESGAWGDPDLLDRLKVRARRFTLGEGETETLELKIADGY